MIKPVSDSSLQALRLSHAGRQCASSPGHSCLCFRFAGNDRPVGGRAIRKDLVLFAKGLKDKEGRQQAVQDLDCLKPAELLAAAAAPGAVKESRQQLSKLLIEDMKIDERAEVCHKHRASQADATCHNRRQNTQFAVSRDIASTGAIFQLQWVTANEVCAILEHCCRYTAYTSYNKLPDVAGAPRVGT